jgi:hypothetical protein
MRGDDDTKRTDDVAREDRDAALDLRRTGQRLPVPLDQMNSGPGRLKYRQGAVESQEHSAHQIGSGRAPG